MGGHGPSMHLSPEEKTLLRNLHEHGHMDSGSGGMGPHGREGMLEAKDFATGLFQVGSAQG